MKSISLFLSFRFNGKDLATSTGFIVETAKGPCLITNCHNVTGRDSFTNKCIHECLAIPNEVVIFHHKHDQPGVWIEKLEFLFVEDQPRWFEHPILMVQ